LHLEIHVFYQKIQVKYEFGPDLMTFDRFLLELGKESKDTKYGIKILAACGGIRGFVDESSLNHYNTYRFYFRSSDKMSLSSYKRDVDHINKH
jgi:hypothetical protein